LKSFQIDINVRQLAPKIQHTDKLLLVGSCFTEHIGDYLSKHKWTVLQNPNGILFNPVSVCQSLISYAENRQYTEADLFAHNEAFHSWQHHSRFSATDKQTALQTINASQTVAHQFLQTADWLIITLGSAWVYELTSEAPNAKPQEIAANNHKGPHAWFNRKLMSIEQLYATLDQLLHRLRRLNPQLKIIFTISPVRHLREGVVENNRSKALLIQAVHQLVEKLDKLYYFPAYELVIDVLRDYRFYAEDMAHPNYQATQFVWEHFVQAAFDEPTQALLQQLNELNAAMAHKPFNTASNAHALFLKKYWDKTQALKTANPHLALEQELRYFGGE
jgi:hypothetical protein